jgi:sarcosine oxidase, subunit alpha
VRRLAPQPGERIDRARPLTFGFDGRPVEGFAGDTIASALIASGHDVLSRSFKYHRPRGELCGCGRCGNSLVEVDGAPGVRACGEPLREGMRVVHQNAWPSLSFDAMRATDLLGGPFTPVGFYYKTLIRPRRLWPLYERVLRRAAGLGRLPASQAEREWRTQYRRRHCDVLVIGGGVAGLSAALGAARLGADVVLCDEDTEPGGELLVEGGHERARALAAEARAAGVELLSRAPALGFFDGLVPVWQGDTLHQIRAARHVVATGAIEQPLVFAENDLPGVMLASGARRLAALYALAPGASAVVATLGDEGLEAALALHERGVRVAAVADLRTDAAERPLAARLQAAGVPLLAGSTVVRALGRQRVERVRLARVDADGLALARSEQELDCELLALSGGTQPASSLARQAGGSAIVELAGAVAGHDAAEHAERCGALGGAEAALALGYGDDAARRAAQEQRAALADAVGRTGETPVARAPACAGERSRGRTGALAQLCGRTAARIGASRRGTARAFVDLDEDVTVKDVRQAVAEGFGSIELSKRYTTATMGPTQGRYSHAALARVLAQATGVSAEQVGATTARPPWTPVPMGVLAGRPFEPAKRSAIDARHRELGASVRWAGDWRRAYDYGDVEAEALAVQRDGGLIDVSTLGKLIVRGPDAGELLDRLYPSRLSNLQPGRIRYGVLCSDAGRITDDGTVCRLDEQSFYVTTTSSGAAAVEQWFSWWLADWRLDAHLTDVTQGVVAVNLAGPRAREVLQRVTELDCSAEAFSYLDAKHAHVAGVACLLLRIGFVGELGYEIHCAASHGERLWDALLAAGADAGIRPFGLEPQRILRLQKQHVLVGQDTDSESTPYGASMPWTVKFDKPQQFIGRFALERLAEREPRERLVGFIVPSEQLPNEGAVVLDGGRAAGQVTSARRSPQLERVIGLAWVPARMAEDGAQLEISDEGRTLQARVATRPFYDPDGKLLRS